MDYSSTPNNKVIAKKNKKTTNVSVKCFVPKCPSNSAKFPNKIFLYGPSDSESRKKWFQAVKRDDNTRYKTTIRCCEDHFDLKKDTIQYDTNNLKDVVNWKKSKKNGCGRNLILKKGVVPHIFECQNINSDIFDEFGKTIARTLKSLPIRTGILAMKQLEDICNKLYEESLSEANEDFISRSVLNDHTYTYSVYPTTKQDTEKLEKYINKIKEFSTINEQNQRKDKTISPKKSKLNKPNQLKADFFSKISVEEEKVDKESDSIVCNLEKSMEYDPNQLENGFFSKISIKEEKVDEESDNFDSNFEKSMEYYDYSTDTASSCYDDCERDNCEEMNVVCKIEAEEEYIV